MVTILDIARHHITLAMHRNERKMQISSFPYAIESDEPYHEKTGFLPM